MRTICAAQVRVGDCVRSTSDPDGFHLITKVDNLTEYGATVAVVLIDDRNDCIVLAPDSPVEILR
jgi:hypothetical protein